MGKKSRLTRTIEYYTRQLGRVAKALIAVVIIVIAIVIITYLLKILIGMFCI